MRYTLLGRSGLRVSEICLGTMTFGEEWGWGAGFDESSRQFSAFLEAGGNFIDTANRYTEGTSERFLGELIKQSGKRDDLVIATKYALVTHERGLNLAGNHRKNMVQSVEGSLRRLQLDHIDILYLHAWDFTTQAEEVMRALHDLVQQGKLFYVAISDTPAWIVSRANAIADLRGWDPFIALQIEYSLLQRTGERDLIPMAEALDLGVVAWAPIAGGALTGKYLSDNGNPKRLQPNSARLNERSASIAREVVQIAQETGYSPAQVAIRWVMQQSDRIIPIIGARNAEQLKDSLGATDIQLHEEHIKRLQAISAIELGFPHDFLRGDGVRDILFGGQLGSLHIPKRRC